MFDRRGFLKFAGGVAVGTLATPVIWQTIDDISIWTQNWPWIPSVNKGNNLNTYIRTTSKMCPSATGMRVRLVDGRPVRVLGDDDHPLSRGGVSALAIAEVQMRYSPSRLKRPLKKTSDGTFVAISWDEAETLLAEALASSRGADGVVCVSGDENGTINELLAGMTAALGSQNFFFMPGEAQPVAAAWRLMGGKGRVGYDFAHSDYILSINAEVLESWGPVVGNRRAWGNARPQDAEPAMRLAYAGPVQTATAAGADLWIPIKPGTEAVFALGVINGLLASGRLPLQAGIQELAAMAAVWTPDKVAAHTGLPEARLDEVVKGLLNARRPLAIAGSALEQGGSAVPVMLGMIINVLLGRVNQDGGMRILPEPTPLVRGAKPASESLANDFTAYVADVAGGKKAGGKTLVFYEANPVYALPAGDALNTLFEKAGFAVSFSCFLDETAQRCDLILPSALGLERLDDVFQPFGVGEQVYALARPVAKPLFESRPAGEVLLSLCGKLGIDPGFRRMEELYQARARQLGADWQTLMAGDCFVSRATLPLPALSVPAAVLAEALKKTGTEGLAVAPVTKRSLGTPTTAIPPFNTKTITRNELSGNTLVARMNKGTAEKLGLRQGNRVRLSNDCGSVLARVGLDEGVTPETVALPAGFGHTAFDAFNAGKGENVMRLFTSVSEPGTGLAVWVCPGVKIVKA